jgi:hypothetical protein
VLHVLHLKDGKVHGVKYFFAELSEAVEHLPQIVDLRMGIGLFMEVD